MNSRSLLRTFLPVNSSPPSFENQLTKLSANPCERSTPGFPLETLERFKYKASEARTLRPSLSVFASLNAVS